MEYIYAALIVHETGAEMTEERLTAVLEAAGIEPDPARTKALVAALEDVDIEDAIATGALATPAATGGSTADAQAEGTDEHPDGEPEADEAGDGEDEDEDEDVSGEGLGQLFG